MIFVCCFYSNALEINCFFLLLNNCYLIDFNSNFNIFHDLRTSQMYHNTFYLFKRDGRFIEYLIFHNKYYQNKWIELNDIKKCIDLLTFIDAIRNEFDSIFFLFTTPKNCIQKTPLEIQTIFTSDHTHIKIESRLFTLNFIHHFLLLFFFWFYVGSITNNRKLTCHISQHLSVNELISVTFKIIWRKKYKIKINYMNYIPIFDMQNEAKHFRSITHKKLKQITPQESQWDLYLLNCVNPIFCNSMNEKQKLTDNSFILFYLFLFLLLLHVT